MKGKSKCNRAAGCSALLSCSTPTHPGLLGTPGSANTALPASLLIPYPQQDDASLLHLSPQALPACNPRHVQTRLPSSRTRPAPVFPGCFSRAQCPRGALSPRRCGLGDARLPHRARSPRRLTPSLAHQNGGRPRAPLDAAAANPGQRAGQARGAGRARPGGSLRRGAGRQRRCSETIVLPAGSLSAMGLVVEALL